MKEPYDAILNGSQKSDNVGSHCVSGPGRGFGYYAFHHYPEFQFHSQDRARDVATMCNSAYRAGYEAAQREIRQALGLKS